MTDQTAPPTPGTRDAPLRSGGTLAPEEVTRLRLAIARLNRQLVQASGGQDLTFAQLSALARVEQFGPLRLGELAARERVAPPSMIRTIATLAGDGLIGKEPDPQDGRSYLIALTPAGREMITRIRQERSQMLAGRISGLSPEQCDALYAAIPVLELLSDEAVGGDPGA